MRFRTNEEIYAMMDPTADNADELVIEDTGEPMQATPTTLTFGQMQKRRCPRHGDQEGRNLSIFWDHERVEYYCFDCYAELIRTNCCELEDIE